MLREETAKLLMMIQGAYPNYKPDNKTVTINTWNLALSDISFDLAQKAFLAYLRADTKGFAPTPGQLIALVRELNTPKQLNELEAWSLVEKAIRNSIYNSQEEFSKLPPLVQKAVGSPYDLNRHFNVPVKNDQQLIYRIIIHSLLKMNRSVSS